LKQRFVAVFGFVGRIGYLWPNKSRWRDEIASDSRHRVGKFLDQRNQIGSGKDKHLCRMMSDKRLSCATIERVSAVGAGSRRQRAVSAARQ
jgi:hypothetical protein